MNMNVNANLNLKSWFARKTRNNNNNNNNDDSSKIRGLRNNRFGRILLQTISLVLSMLVTTILFYPASSMATTMPDLATAVATVAPIITCPVSAATELRLMGRLIYAALIGAALGKERSLAKHSAGVRTMSLVSMGATVFIVCSCYGFANFPRVDGKRALLLYNIWNIIIFFFPSFE